MKLTYQTSAITVMAFAVAMPFALVACSESNSTSSDEPIAYSEPAPGTSSALESSSSVAELSSAGTECQGISVPEGKLCLQEECDAENEGRVIDAKHGNPKYGYQVYYAQCKQGAWTSSEPWAACDTAGVAVGDTCRKQTRMRGNQFGGDVHTVFVYAGDGVWKYKDPHEDPKDLCSLPNDACTESNAFKIDSTLKSAVSLSTCYALCRNNKWELLKEFLVAANAYCGDPKINGYRCCFHDAGYPAYYEYTYDSGWNLKEYTTECKDAEVNE